MQIHRYAGFLPYTNSYIALFERTQHVTPFEISENIGLQAHRLDEAISWLEKAWDRNIIENPETLGFR